MKLIIGLGNPGKEYIESRHNIGFKIVNFINKEYGGTLSVPKSHAQRDGDFILDKKSNSDVAEVKIYPVKSAKGGAALRQFNRVNSKKALLVKPQTFVNKSGEAVKKIVTSLKFKVSSLVVIHDDLDIPFGKVKLSFGRSSAGHKGVQSIIRALKTDKFYRIRIGTFNKQLVKIRKIKDGRKRLDEMNKFVIGPFSSSEKIKLSEIIKEAAQKAVLVISDRL